MAKKISYGEAIAEIEEIIRKIEQEELDVDELSDKVKRVSFLINYCREKLLRQISCAMLFMSNGGSAQFCNPVQECR